MDLPERLRRETKHRNIDSAVLDFKAGLPKGTVEKILAGGPADDPVIEQLARALDIPPSVLLYGVEDPAALWRDEDMRHSASLNAVWRTATNRGLTPTQTRELFEQLTMAGSRYRHGLGITQDMADRACRELFPEPQSRSIGNDDPFDPRVEE